MLSYHIITTARLFIIKILRLLLCSTHILNKNFSYFFHRTIKFVNKFNKVCWSLEKRNPLIWSDFMYYSSNKYYVSYRYAHMFFARRWHYFGKWQWTVKQTNKFILKCPVSILLASVCLSGVYINVLTMKIITQSNIYLHEVKFWILIQACLT